MTIDTGSIVGKTQNDDYRHRQHCGGKAQNDDKTTQAQHRKNYNGEQYDPPK
jgi:hypothetical protein